MYAVMDLIRTNSQFEVADAADVADGGNVTDAVITKTRRWGRGGGHFCYR